ncbi:MAG TPA: nucleotidyltransferase family protein [Acidobacteriota bacterium]|nr:nucleotidyltransferase family protein [Acidobacteriota bacterium]
MNHSYSWKPTPAQTLLLKASLFEDSRSIEAWEKWQECASVDELDKGSFRLLPLLYKNLQRQGVPTPLLNKLKGVYRQTWYANQIIFHDVFHCLKVFHELEIPTLLLKGAALVFFHYKDFGLRPMSDIDVLIPISELARATDVLQRLGWHSDSTESVERALWFKNTWLFHHFSGGKLELHWYAISQSRQRNIDKDFWKRARSVDYQDVKTLATSPSDTLFHVCIHGAKWNEVPPMRWIADAIQIMKTSRVDWNSIIEEGKKRRLIVALRKTLSFLAEEFHGEIPKDVLHEISAIHVSKSELVLFESIQTEADFPMKQKGPELWTKYRKLMSFKGAHLVSLNFFFFLQHWWDLAHVWNVFFYAPIAFGKWVARKRNKRQIPASN